MKKVKIENYVQINMKIKDINKYIFYELEMTQSHIIILYLILNSVDQKLDLKGLCEETASASSVITRQVKELEQKGYVKKIRNEDNLRKVYVYMSNKQKEDTLALMDLIEEYIKQYTL